MGSPSSFSTGYLEQLSLFELFQSLTMRNVFRVSWLKPYIGPPINSVLDEQQPEVLDKAEVIELEQIPLHRLKHGLGH